MYTPRWGDDRKKCTPQAIIIADHVADAIRAAAVPVELDVLLRNHLLLSAQYV
jgi:hypothetical protein